MISFDLRCSRDHVFEAWFADSNGFEKERRTRRVACPLCGDTKVEKALMSPNVARGASEERPPAATKDATSQALQMLVKLRDQVEMNCDFVGEKFAEEARKIHYGEVDKRNIYGKATTEEADGLRDEGIEFGEIPWIPRFDT